MESMQPLKVQLFPKKDTDDQIFYIGKLNFPGIIKLNRGCLFFVYLEEGIEELHICPTKSLNVNDPSKYYTRARRKKARSKHNNISIELEPFYTEDKKELEYFAGSITSDIQINASEGVVFLVFIADSGEEEVQISISGTKSRQKRKGKTGG